MSRIELSPKSDRFLITPTPTDDQLSARQDQVNSLTPQVARFLEDYCTLYNTDEVPLVHLFNRVNGAASRMVMRATIWHFRSLNPVEHSFIQDTSTINEEPTFVLRREIHTV